jgi:hypothetical protein
MIKRALTATAGAVAALVLLLASPAWAATWVVQPVPLPSGGTFGMFLGESCASASDCVAVGWSRSSPSTVEHPLAELWNGSTWAVTATPLPAGGTSGELEAVSCTLTGGCTAVGYYTSSGGPGAGVPLAERWDGTSWSVRPVPVQAGASGVLTAVSCTPAVCTAAGSYTTTAGADLALAERWNGSTWAEQATILPGGATSDDFSGVSCPTTTRCMAIGSSNAAGNSLLAESWNGASWGLTAAPAAPGGSSPSLVSISCPIAANCTAVGTYDTTTLVPLAEHWDGSAWSVRPVAAPTGAVISALISVSCPTASKCTAAGYYNLQTAGVHPLAEAWTGSAWSKQPTGSPATHKMFNAISCTGVSSCEVAGLTQHPEPGFTTLLAEQES